MSIDRNPPAGGNQPRRRDVLKLFAALAAGSTLGALLSPRVAAAADAPRKKVLFFTKSSGFQHSVIARKDERTMGLAERLLPEIAAARGIDVTVTKDGSLFTPDGIAPYDGFAFYTTGNLAQAGTDKQPPMPPDGEATLISAVESGKGFVGIHCGSDTFHSPGFKQGTFPTGQRKLDPYIAMLGGEFIVHGAQQQTTQHVVDRRFPGFENVNDFDRLEEWYSLSNFAPDLHVLLVNQTKSMKGSMYERPPYPSTWARRHGKGRVFYTSMGHRDDVWGWDVFHAILLGGLSWAVGLAEADVTPNIKDVCPDIETVNPDGTPAK